MFANLFDKSTDIFCLKLEEEYKPNIVKFKETERIKKMRNVFEKTEYEIYLQEDKLPENVLKVFQIFLEEIKNNIDKKVSNVIFNMKHKEINVKCWKTYSRVKDLSSVKEILFKVIISNRYITPIIFLKETEGDEYLLLKQLQLKPDKKEEDTEVKDFDPNIMTCQICFNNLRSVLFVNCHHFCSCFNCSEKLHKCPICRSPIDMKTKVIFS